MTETELAARAGTTEEKVRRLAGHGILSRPDPPFEPADVLRVRMSEAFEQAGIPSEDLGKAIAAEHISFDFVHRFYTEGAELSDKTYREVCDGLGLSLDLVQRLQLGLGLPRPGPEERIRKDGLEILPLLVASLQLMGGEGAVTRSSYVWGESLRRLAEAQNESFERLVMQPLLRSGMSEQQMLDTASRMGMEWQPMVERMIVWLYRRHLDHYITQSVLEHFENAMDQAGLVAKRTKETPAIAFLDLTGYTRLTEERGDEAAAELAASLSELVQATAPPHSGKMVKLLGDGVMFHFGRPADAVLCGLELIDRAPEVGLPPAHVGIDAGPVVFRDGDYFGRTVNIAARIADRAGPAEVLVSEEVAAATAPDGVRFEGLGPVELKGVARPVSVYRAVRA